MQFIDLAAQQARLRAAIDAAIARVLDHGKYIMGPEIAELETALGAAGGAPEVVSCASGTDALLLALLARGVGPGDAVLVPTFTFAATAEAVALLGATPVFVDVDAVTFNIDVAGVAAAIESPTSGLRVVGIIGVDLFGLPADYPKLTEIAEAHDLWVVADAAQSFGASAHGVPVGAMAPLTTTSFFPAKPLGCYGDGGAVLATGAEDAAVMRSLRVHGSGSDKYDNVRIGINGRLDTLQAAILLQKLTVFESEIESRQVVAARYAEGLGDLVVVPTVPKGSRSAWAQYTVRVSDRAAVSQALSASGVPTAVYYPLPLHQQTAYRAFPVGAAGTKVSELLATEVLSLPMHPYLTATDQDIVIDTLRSAVQRNHSATGESTSRP